MRCLLQKARKTRRRRRRKNGNAGRNGQLEKREQRGKTKPASVFPTAPFVFSMAPTVFPTAPTVFPTAPLVFLLNPIRLSRVFPPSWNVPAGEDRTAGSAHSDMHPTTVLPAPGGHSPAGKERVGEEAVSYWLHRQRSLLYGSQSRRKPKFFHPSTNRSMTNIA